MFPMMDPDKMKPMEEDEAVKKMASIGAIMEGAGDSFSEDDMRLFRDAFMGTNALEEQMEALISRPASSHSSSSSYRPDQRKPGP